MLHICNWLDDIEKVKKTRLLNINTADTDDSNGDTDDVTGDNVKVTIEFCPTRLWHRWHRRPPACHS